MDRLQLLKFSTAPAPSTPAPYVQTGPKIQLLKFSSGQEPVAPPVAP